MTTQSEPLNGKIHFGIQIAIVLSATAVGAALLILPLQFINQYEEAAQVTLGEVLAPMIVFSVGLILILETIHSRRLDRIDVRNDELNQGLFTLLRKTGEEQQPFEELREPVLLNRGQRLRMLGPLGGALIGAAIGSVWGLEAIAAGSLLGSAVGYALERTVAPKNKHEKRLLPDDVELSPQNGWEANLTAEVQEVVETRWGKLNQEIAHLSSQVDSLTTEVKDPVQQVSDEKQASDGLESSFVEEFDEVNREISFLSEQVNYLAEAIDELDTTTEAETKEIFDSRVTILDQKLDELSQAINEATQPLEDTIEAINYEEEEATTSTDANEQYTREEFHSQATAEVVETVLDTSSSSLLVVSSSPELIKEVISAATAYEGNLPAIRMLSRPEIVDELMDDFMVASLVADLIENDILSLHTVKNTTIDSWIFADEADTALMTNHHVGGWTRTDDTFASRVYDGYSEEFEGADDITLRTPSISRVRETLAEEISPDVKTDFDAILDALDTVLSDGLDEVMISLLVTAKNEELLYDISKWGEDVGVASKATFSRTKTKLENKGLIEGEKVPIDVGRPRIRLKLRSDLRGESIDRILSEFEQAI